MKQFLDENFLLETTTAQELYHGFARDMPIVDYHNHLSPELIASDHNFENLTQAWLYGDHYKWRALRSNGVAEAYCTGGATDYQKFLKWAETVPYTLRNPLFHWTHMELQRYFGIKDLLNPASAKKIYESCSELLLSNEFSVKQLLRKMNVKLLCTTDDPTDSLEHHLKLQHDDFDVTVLPAFRPDKALNVDNADTFNQYVTKLESVSNIEIRTFWHYLDALKGRHDFFAQRGCTVMDQGLAHLHAEDYSDTEVEVIFRKIQSGKELAPWEGNKFKSAVLENIAIWNWEKGWVQQYHLGPLRNNNSRMMTALGPDTGWDSMGDFQQATQLSKFLDRLDASDRLAKTILYNLNPRDNELFASMAGNFNDGSVKGKVQYGAAWWFMDQKYGMINQLNAVSNLGLISNFVGMLTDSRSFLSFPRHEYFRRILCNLFGEEIEKGELPYDLEWTGKLIQDICFHNAVRYFNWEETAGIVAGKKAVYE